MQMRLIRPIGMRMQVVRRLRWPRLVLLLLAMAMGAMLASAGPDAGAGTFQETTISPVRQPSQSIIVDHTCTDLSQIPPAWLAQAQELAIHYAHTSHGSQIMSGLEKLEQVDPAYSYHQFDAGATPPASLPCAAGELCVYDGNPPETYITPEDYWETTEGISRTQAVAETGLFDYSQWSWCGQASYYSDDQIRQYLDQMALFETWYPDMRFILMTGHTDGGSADLDRHNAMIRQYAIDHQMVLFDFADIETYDPLGGGPYVNNSEGTCTWCASFCASHPEYCTDLPDSCAHSSSPQEARLFCKLKANAFWWLMARLAGWDGGQAPLPVTGDKSATDSTPASGQVVSYTIAIQNQVLPATTVLSLTDDLPAGLSYVSGTLTATVGTVDDSAAPHLAWNGTLGAGEEVTVSYAALVDAPPCTVLTNTALLSAAGYLPLTITHSIVAHDPAVDDGCTVYVPLVQRE